MKMKRKRKKMMVIMTMMRRRRRKEMMKKTKTKTKNKNDDNDDDDNVSEDARTANTSNDNNNGDNNNNSDRHRHPLLPRLHPLHKEPLFTLTFPCPCSHHQLPPRQTRTCQLNPGKPPNPKCRHRISLSSRNEHACHSQSGKSCSPPFLQTKSRLCHPQRH